MSNRNSNKKGNIPPASPRTALRERTRENERERETYHQFDPILPIHILDCHVGGLDLPKLVEAYMLALELGRRKEDGLEDYTFFK